MATKILIVVSFFFCISLPCLALPAEHIRLAAEWEQKALAAQNPAEITESRNSAIQEYEAALDEGLANSALYGKLGTLYLQQDDLGHAILNLKKALLFSPRDPIIRTNLDLARTKRFDHFVEEDKNDAVKTLAFFHYEFGYPTRVNVALASWFLLAALGILLFWKRPLWLVTLTVLCGITACLFGTSAALTAYSLRHNQIAVVATADTTPRKGDGDAYAPATTAKLHAGTEVTIRRERGDWSYVILPGNIPAWIYTHDLAK